MPTPRIDPEAFEWLGEQIDPPPPIAPKAVKEWKPRQTPAQRKLMEAWQRFILCWGPKGGSKCRTPDTMVYTAGGLRRLGSMKPIGARVGLNAIDVPVLAFDGQKIVEASATGFWVEDGKMAVRCELDNGGELTGSPRHPLWVCAQAPDGAHSFRYASLEEMMAAVNSGWRFWTPFVGHDRWTQTALSEIDAGGQRITLTEDLGYAIGALVGDGSLNIDHDDRSVGFTNTDPECVARVKRGLAQIGCEVRNTSRQKPYEYRVLPAGKIRPLIRSLGIAHLSYSKFIPDAIISSPKSVAAAFLRGLFDTDGSADIIGRVHLVTVSERLGRDVQDLLAALGILSARRRVKSASGNPTWRVSVNGAHAERFFCTIGFEVERKQRRKRIPMFSVRCPHGFNHNRFGYPDPIRKVCRAAWRAAPISKSRIAKLKYKSLCSFGSIPGPHKVKKIIETFGSGDHFAPFLISENWLEIKKLTRCEAELYDLSVPGPTSFLASGTINHNTFGVLDKMVDHCYNNRNALGLIIVKVSNMAVKGGAWDKLISEVLPRWRDGNTDRAGNKLDEGMGLVYTDVKFDANHCPYIWIQNKYGTWCMITVMSCPHAQQLRARIRGVEPSFVFLDEATSCDSAEYFESVAAQLGRRPQVQGVQHFVAATNPEDPDHWVFLKWFIEPYDDATGEKDPQYHDIFFPAEENKENLQPGYLEGLASIYGRNATEAARMIGGEWVAQPTGEALFGDLFNILVHVRPLDERMQPHTQERLCPVAGYPMIIGIDPGAVYNAFVFLQRLPIENKMRWLVFDEIVLLRQKIKYDLLVPVVMRRVKWWREVVGAEIPQVWNSDDSAFNVFRAAHGSYDALVIERIYEENRRAIGLEQMRIKAAPKFAGSVEARISIEQAALANDEIIVSAACPRVRAMYQRLESEKQKANAPFDPKLAVTPRRSDHLHVFDAGSYPKLTMSIQPSLLQPTRGGPTLFSARAA